MRFLCISIILIFINNPAISSENKMRSDLRALIKINEIKPLKSEPFEVTKKYLLGQALFFDPILSTNNDISCATCHLVSKGTSDNLERSLGTGSHGLSLKRTSNNNNIVNSRNSLSLYNRDHNTVTSLFWDGRVEVLDSKNRRFRSPLQHLLPRSIENALAAQAIFPLVNDREMFTRKCPLDKSCTLDLDDPLVISEEHDRILYKLLGVPTPLNMLTKSQIRYRALFRSAYTNLDLGEIDIGHLGNAIAHFEEVAFATRDAVWDRYVAGEESILSYSAVRGASIFYSDTGCVSCHSGAVFSDYEFYSLGVLSYKELSPVNKVDFGRFDITKEDEDIFLFRTPSLRNVTLTAPYFHDGSVLKLDDAILKHNRSCSGPDELIPYCLALKLNKKFGYVNNLKKQDINDLINFLKSLEDNVEPYWNHIVPRSVPSGLPVHTLIIDK